MVAVADVVERASEFSVERELKALVHRDLGHWLDVVLLGSGDSVVHLEGHVSEEGRVQEWAVDDSVVHLEDLVCGRPCTGMRIETVELEEGEGPCSGWSC